MFYSFLIDWFWKKKLEKKCVKIVGNDFLNSKLQKETDLLNFIKKLTSTKFSFPKKSFQFVLS